MRIAHVINNKVVNVIEADAIWSSNASEIYIQSDSANIGWILENGELKPEPIDYILSAEKFVESYFSTTRLLQCKVWLDLIPHESTPKLISVFQWTATVTGMALQGIGTFPQPPATFLEVAQECVPLLNS